MNVIVIACNGLHLGFLGPYGNAWIETPNLDRLASEGVVFDHHFPENLTTLPTRRSWWTGRYGFPDPDLGWTPLRPDEPILPDLLVRPRGPLGADLRRADAPPGRPRLRPRLRRGRLDPGPGVRPLHPPRRPPGRRRPPRRRAGPAPAARGRPGPGPLGRAAGSSTSATARRWDSTPRRTPARAAPSGRRSTGSNAGARTRTSRSSSGSTCSARTAPGTRRRSTATSTSPSSPTSSRPARRATLEEEDEARPTT